MFDQIIIIIHILQYLFRHEGEVVTEMMTTTQTEEHKDSGTIDIIAVSNNIYGGTLYAADNCTR